MEEDYSVIFLSFKSQSSSEPMSLGCEFHKCLFSYSVLVCLGCHNKVLSTGGLKEKKFIFS